jgi:hypothetical protein
MTSSVRAFSPTWVRAYQCLDLAHRLAPGRVDPLDLGLGHRHPRQLPHRRPRQRAVRERARHRRQLRQRLGDAQPLERDARRIAEHAFEVLQVAAHPEVRVQRRAPAGEHERRFVRVELAPPRPEPDDLLVQFLPVHARSHDTAIPDALGCAQRR